MKRHTDEVLSDLKELLLSMGGLVEKAIENAVEGFQERNRAKIAVVDNLEKQINEHHLAVDEACIKLLALQQPMASDLRFIVAAIKINCDLERMGDQAVNIAGNAERSLDNISDELRSIVDFSEMVKLVRSVVRDVLDSFVSRNLDQAKKVLFNDDKVDELKNSIFSRISEYLRSHPENVDQGLSYILIARNLEKIGDHASNIAEDVIFLISGKDVRHPMLFKEKDDK